MSDIENDSIINNPIYLIDIDNNSNINDSNINNQINLIDNDLNYCIICFGKYNFIQNKLCKCIYYYHTSCYFDWVKQSNKEKCIMCKEDVILNKLTSNNLEYLNINFITSIENPINKIVNKYTYKYNDSINKRRIEIFISNNEINLLTMNPKDLMVYIFNNVNIPNKKFNYEWNNIKLNNTINTITLSYILNYGILYSIKDLENTIKNNYINCILYPGKILENKVNFDNELDNIVSSNNQFEEENNTENTYRYDFIDDNDNVICIILKRYFGCILVFLFIIDTCIIISYKRIIINK